MNGKWKHFIALSAIAGISWLLVQNPLTEHYFYTLKHQGAVAIKNEDVLYKEISKRAKKYEISPKNAKIDSIWKTVPGYNGLKVDVDASYKMMKNSGVFDEKKLIYIQVKPTKHISDLPPAPIYRAHPDKPVVSLLINVAWGNEYLQDMLATLKKNGVKATFFLEGKWTKNNPELAKMIAEGGHEIGNHSYSHPDMKILSANRINEEIKKTNDIIKAVTGVTCTWFAPPSGSFRDETITIASSYKMGTIMWSVDTIDWQKPSPEVLTQRVLSKLHPGAFILMHPTEASEKSLDTLIKTIKNRNLHLMTVTQALKEDRIMH